MTRTNQTAAQMLAQFNRDFAVCQAKQEAARARGPVEDFDFEFSPVGAKVSKPSTEDFELNPVK